MKKILVTGSKGQLGMEFRSLENCSDSFQFLFTDRLTFSLEDETQMRKFFEENKPDYCINCAAYTLVDAAESNRESADLINNDAVGVLAKLAKEFQCKLIHISTDYVFNSSNNTPLTEVDAISPVNYYGESKYGGELNCIANNSEAIIIRTSWLYSSFGNNFVKTMLRLMAERKELTVVNDQIGSPTYANDLAETIIVIISSNKWVSGTYHFANKGTLSWFEFAAKIKEFSGLECNVLPIPSSEYLTPAKRPLFSILNTDKIQEIYNVKIPPYLDSLKKCISIL